MATGTSGEKRDDELTDHEGDDVSTEATDATDPAGQVVGEESPATDDAAAEEPAAVDEEDADDGGATAVAVTGDKAADRREKKGKTTSRREGEENAKKKTAAESGNPIARFFREVISELKKVVTPTRKELWRYVGVVLAFLVIVMLLVALFDFVFNYASSWVFGTGTELFPQGSALEPTAPWSLS